MTKKIAIGVVAIILFNIATSIICGYGMGITLRNIAVTGADTATWVIMVWLAVRLAKGKGSWATVGWLFVAIIVSEFWEICGRPPGTETAENVANMFLYRIFLITIIAIGITDEVKNA
jgi:hypothetical protein